MGNRPTVYKHDCPNSHEGQQAKRKEGHLIGLYTSAFQKIDIIFANKAWENLTEDKRQFALSCPFLNVVATAGGSNGLGRFVPMIWGTRGDGVGEKEPPVTASSASAETQSLLHAEPVALGQTEVPGATWALPVPHPPRAGLPWDCCLTQAGIPAWGRAVLPALHGLSCSCNSCSGSAAPKPGWNLTTGRVCSESGIPSSLKIWQRRESSPAEQMEMGWGCNPAALKQNLSFFLSLCPWMQKPQVLKMHGPDYSCSKHKIKRQRGSKSWQIPIFIIISFLAVSGAFYHSQAS